MVICNLGLGLLRVALAMAVWDGVFYSVLGSSIASSSTSSSWWWREKKLKSLGRMSLMSNAIPSIWA